MIPLGCKNPDIKHVMSFRRQAFMIFNSQSDPLNLSAKLSIDGKDYTIFISSDSMRCFVCGDFGHIRQTCPIRDRPAGLPAAPAADAENSEKAENNEKAPGADVTSAAGVSEPQTGEAFSAPGDLPEIPALVASKDGLVEAAEEVAGPSHIPAVPQAETSPEQVSLQAVPVTDSLCFESSLTKLRATQLLMTRLIKVKMIFHLKNLWIQSYKWMIPTRNVKKTPR